MSLCSVWRVYGAYTNLRIPDSCVPVTRPPCSSDACDLVQVFVSHLLHSLFYIAAVGRTENIVLLDRHPSYALLLRGLSVIC